MLVSITAAETVFDGVTGAPVSAAQLKTYQEALAQYHLSCEDKFANGEFLDCGETIRRHVVATQLVLIGKEANRIGESGETDPIVEATRSSDAKSRDPERVVHQVFARLGRQLSVQ